MKLRQSCLVHWWLWEAPSLNWIPGMKIKKILGQLYYLLPSPFKHTVFFFFYFEGWNHQACWPTFEAAESETESEVMKRKPQKKKKKEREREWETDKAIISVSFSTLYPRPGHGASTCADWGAKKASKNSSPWLLLYHRWGIWRGEVRWGRKGWHFPRRSIREGKTPLTAASKVVFWGFFNNKRLNFSVSLYHQRH